MASRRRWLPALVFICPLLLGTWGCCSLKCRQDTAPVLNVSQTDNVPPEHDPVRISKAAGQQILWWLPEGSTVSSVRIALAGQSVPFDRCVAGEGGYCSLPCQNRVCASGPVSASLEIPAGTYKYYGYDFQHASGASSSDPGIRIDP
jgi:hypothetical protein